MQNIDLVKVDNENLPQAIVVRTDSNGESKYFQVFDSELANLSKEEFAKLDLEELTSSLTASEVNLVDSTDDVGEAFAISRAELKELPSSSSALNNNDQYSANYGYGLNQGGNNYGNDNYYGGGNNYGNDNYYGGGNNYGGNYGGGIYGYGYGYSFPYSYGYSYGYRSRSYSIYRPSYGYGYASGSYGGGYGTGY